MTKLSEIIPDTEVLLALEMEELGGAVLTVLNTEGSRADAYSFIYFLFQHPTEYPGEHKREIEEAILEAWAWLTNAGFIAERYNPGGPREFFVTRAGRSVSSIEELERFRTAAKLPKDLLHPRIYEMCWAAFIRGEYDTAVFKAFKEVEIAVRSAGGFSAGDIGVPLMRAAFHKTNGPLTESELPEGERESLQHLFAGAIGSYKNPGSHRTVTIGEPVEAAEMIILASHLLRIVDARATP